MKNDKKYYTPNIEDIFIGYEGEYFSHYHSNFQWKETIIDFEYFSLFFENDTLDSEWFNDNWRTKYLDKDDILKLGFELSNVFDHVYRKDDVYIDYFNHDDIIIYKYDKYGNEEYLFKGSCPSINELRKVLKLIQK